MPVNEHKRAKLSESDAVPVLQEIALTKEVAELTFGGVKVERQWLVVLEWHARVARLWVRN